jgi:hypothetical protein
MQDYAAGVYGVSGLVLKMSRTATAVRANCQPTDRSSRYNSQRPWLAGR